MTARSRCNSVPSMQFERGRFYTQPIEAGRENRGNSRILANLPLRENSAGDFAFKRDYTDSYPERSGPLNVV